MYRAFFPAVAVFCAALSGCAEQVGNGPPIGSGAGKTTAEVQLERDVRSLNEITRDIVVMNTAQGAIAGALAGCGAALIFGGDTEDCLAYGAAGGVAGGVVGNQVGRQAAAVNRELVRQDEIIDNLQGINTRLNTVSVSLRNVVQSQNAEIASLRRQVASEQISASQYEARVNAINANRQTVRQGLQASQTNVQRNYQELASLEQESGQNLSQSRAAAASTERRLAQLSNSVALISTN